MLFQDIDVRVFILLASIEGFDYEKCSETSVILYLDYPSCFVVAGTCGLSLLFIYSLERTAMEAVEDAAVGCVEMAGRTVIAVPDGTRSSRSSYC